MTFTMSIVLDGEDVEVEVSGRYTPGDPGRYYGPPEHCHPGEPAMFEPESVIRNDTNEDILASLPESVFDAICERGEREAEERSAEPDSPDDYDDRY